LDLISTGEACENRRWPTTATTMHLANRGYIQRRWPTTEEAEMFRFNQLGTN